MHEPPKIFASDRIVVKFMKPSTIKISLHDGDPNGIRVARISMSTIQAIALRRNQLRRVLHRVREDFPVIERPGIYILIGADEGAQDGQLAYIGESEDVGDRLRYHNSNEAGRDAKDFWTDTVVLTSIDEDLTKSHARYVEACLIRGVGSNPRWTLPNTRIPSDTAGKLPLPDRAAMDEFVDQTKTLVGALGWDLFREIRGRTPERIPEQELQKADPHESPRFFSSGNNGFNAEMVIGPSGNFVIKAESKARNDPTPTIPISTMTLRNTLFDKGVLRKEDGFLVFTSDYSFNSPSAAAGVVYGGSVNGRSFWKLQDGCTTYADWEANQGAADGWSGQL